MPTLIFERVKEHHNNRAAYKIFIDGENVESIRNDEKKELTVTEGDHLVFVKLGANRSQTLAFKISESETRVFQLCVSRSGNLVDSFGRLLFPLLILTGIWFRGSAFFISLAVFIVATTFFIAFITREDYFSLTEINEIETICT